MITLAQLSQSVSQQEAYDTLVAYLAGQGYRATSWQDGSIQKTLLWGFAWLYSAVTGTVSDLAAAGYPALAGNLTSTVWQDALGQYFYNNPRIPATVTEGTITLTLSAAAAPAAWAAGELVIADGPVAPANSYRIVSGGSLAPGGSDTFVFDAETAGAAANISPNVPLFLWTPITGLSATNPAIVGTSTWITTEGQDQEANDRYAARMIGQWSQLTYGNTQGAYEAWALAALPALTRVFCTTGSFPGSVIITGATASGPLTSPQIATITAYINGVTDGVGRRPINDILTVQGATTVTSPSVVLTVTCASALAFGCAAAVTTALIALFGSLPIGGKRIAPNPIGFVFTADMYKAIMAIPGVQNVTGIPGDIALNPTDIYTPPIVITVVST